MPVNAEIPVRRCIKNGAAQCLLVSMLLFAGSLWPTAAVAEERPTDYVRPQIGASIAAGGVNRRTNQTVSATAPYGRIQAGASRETYRDTSFDGFHLNIAAGNGAGRGMGFIGKTLPVAAALESQIPNFVSGKFVKDVIVWDFVDAEAGYQRGTVSYDGSTLTVEIVARPRYALFRISRASSGPLALYAPSRSKLSFTYGYYDQAQHFTEISTQRLEGWMNYQTKSLIHWSFAFQQQPDSANGVGVGWNNRSQVVYAAAVSSVSEEGARGNLPATIPDFDTARAEARADWDRELSRITIDPNASTDLKTKFYTAFFRVLTYPQIYSDVDGRYRRYHASGDSTDIDTLPEDWQHYYSHYSGWDTYRIHSPLMSLLAPDIASEQARSLLENARADGERVAKWGLWGHDSGNMSGNSGAMIVAWSYLMGANGLSFNGTADLSILDSRSASRNFAPRRPSPELDHGAASFTMGLLAKHLGHDSFAQGAFTRSQRWWELWNPDAVEPPAGQGGIRPKDEDGNWKDDGEYGYNDGSDYVEALQDDTQWLAHWDLAELVQRMGSTSVARARLDRYFWDDAIGASRCFRTYNDHFTLYNQPVYSLPWTWGQIGDSRRQVDEVHRIVHDDFLTIDGKSAYPGNDDLGATSAWLMWSMMGLYPYWPGVPVLAVNAPVLDHAELQMGGKRLTITRSGSGDYVEAVSVNGEALTTTWVPVARLLAQDANTLHFTMAADGQWGMESTPPNWRTQTVSADNAQPGIDAVTELTVAGGSLSGPHAVLIHDLETPAVALLLSATSSDQSLINDADIQLASGQQVRTLQFTTGSGNGSVVLTLSVEDGDGAVQQHSIAVTVGDGGGGGNQAPLADAGPDQVVTAAVGASSASVTLDGSASTDPDGSVVAWDWSWSGGSADGANPSITLPLGTTVVTLSVSDDDGASASDAVTITVEEGVDSGLPEPWQYGDVGSPAVAGSASYSDGVFILTAAGHDIWEDSDTFHFVRQALNPPVRIEARITHMDEIHAWTKAGLMMRASSAADARHAMLLVRPSGAVHLLSRSSDGAMTESITGPDLSFPVWLRLERIGPRIDAYTSADGSHWQPLAGVSMDLGAGSLVGLALTSHDDSQTASADFDQVTVTPLVSRRVSMQAIDGWLWEMEDSGGVPREPQGDDPQRFEDLAAERSQTLRLVPTGGG